ncbi:MAG TPA: PAS domain-containing protein, partial [Desulfobacterales bacterium]
MVEIIKKWIVTRVVGDIEVLDPDFEPRRKTFLINMMILLGNFFLAVLAAIAMAERNFLLAAVDITVFLFLTLLFIYLKKTKRCNRVAYLGTLATGLFYLFLTAYGGENNTASIWALTYPLIAIFLLGATRGLAASLALLASIIAVFIAGPMVAVITTYHNDFIIRFIPAYLVIFLFAVVMEEVRESIQSRLKTANRQLETAIQEVHRRTDDLGRANQELTVEIAERKRIEKALRDSESFLGDVIESIQDGISVLEPDLNIRHTNSVMRDWYRSQVPLVGKKCYECYQKQSTPCEPCPTLRCLQSGQTEREVVCGPSGSEERWLELYSYPIKDKESGRVTGVVEFARDISERKRLENQLARTERMDSIGRLAGGIAHDFNNILTGIQGRTSLMLSELDPNHPLVEHLEGVEFYVKNAADLTGRLLGFARGGKYEVQVTDINTLVKDNLMLFGRTKKELVIESDLHTDLWLSEVDQGQISQVFLNLFVNAWEAMPHGGELRVKTGNVILDDHPAKNLSAMLGKYVIVKVAD